MTPILLLIWVAACLLIVLMSHGTLGAAIDFVKQKINSIVYWLKGRH